MRTSTLRIILAASLLLNISFLATAGYVYIKETGYWVSPFGTKMKKDRFLFEELSLRPEQAKQMKEKATHFRTEVDAMRSEIGQKRKQLISLMRAGSPDAGALDAVIAEISRLQEEMQRKVTSHMLAEKELLDKDQQGKFLDLIENAMTHGMGQGRQAACPPADHP